jgi:hypothetical protein
MRAPANAKIFENVRSTITPSSSSGTAVRPLYSKYASSTTSGRAAGSGSSAPVGLFGRQAKVRTGSSSPIAAPASRAAIRKSGYVGAAGMAIVSPGPAYARAHRRIRSSAPTPSTTFSGSTPAYPAIAVRRVR